MGATAYATGNHVAFGGASDLHTAAHEAAHIVQQRACVHLQGGVGKAGDAHEQHADAVADKVVRGESAERLLDAYAGGGVRGGYAAPPTGAPGTGAPQPTSGPGTGAAPTDGAAALRLGPSLVLIDTEGAAPPAGTPVRVQVGELMLADTGI